MAAKKKAAKKIRKSRAVKVKVPDQLELDEIGLPTEDYWFGVRDVCPMQYMSMGGATFMKFNGTPVFDTKGNPDRPLQTGHVGPFSEPQIERIQHAVQSHVMRMFTDKGGKTRGRLMSIDSSHYRHNRAQDVPIAALLFMIPDSEASSKMRKEKNPMSMMEGPEHLLLRGLAPSIGNHKAYTPPDDEEDAEQEQERAELAGENTAPTPIT